MQVKLRKMEKFLQSGYDVRVVVKLRRKTSLPTKEVSPRKPPTLNATPHANCTTVYLCRHAPSTRAPAVKTAQAKSNQGPKFCVFNALPPPCAAPGSGRPGVQTCLRPHEPGRGALGPPVRVRAQISRSVSTLAIASSPKTVEQRLTKQGFRRALHISGFVTNMVLSPLPESRKRGAMSNFLKKVAVTRPQVS